MPTEKWTPVIPAPESAPKPGLSHSRRGLPKDSIHVRDAEGRTLGYVCTFVRSTGELIEQTLTWCVNWHGSEGNEYAWRWVQFPKLRPIYAQAELAAEPEATALLVFSARSVAAASELLPAVIALSWPGGIRKIHEVDWSPLRGRMVYVWPDAQRPKTANAITAILLDYGCTVLLIDVDREAHAPGWSLADALAEGFTGSDAQSWLAERASLGAAAARLKKKSRGARRRAARWLAAVTDWIAGRLADRGRNADRRLARRRAAAHRGRSGGRLARR